MRDSKHNHRFFLGLVLLVVGLSTIGIFPSNASKSAVSNTRSNGKPAQNIQVPRPRAEKFIGKLAIYPNEPVYVTALTVNGIQQEINRTVMAGSEDWLKGMTFEVRNISKKNIVFIYASLIFPDAKAITGTAFGFDLRYGADPKVQPASSTEKPLKPEEAAKFVLSDTVYQNLKRGIEAHVTPIKNLNSVQIDIVKVVFDDDTAWATGSFMHRGVNGAWVDDKT